MTDVNAAIGIGSPNNAARLVMPISGLGPAVTLCPSAFSVQIMNPDAIGVTKGIVYAGVMNTQAKVRGRVETWDSYFDKFVEFQNPRLLAAGKLAIRGAQIDSYPLNMSEISNFTKLSQDTDATITWGLQEEPTGWAPIMIYNTYANDSVPLALEVLVTTEWRVRFDLDNPAAASHIHHSCASDQTWDTHMRRAAAMGNGVKDIVEAVASAGQMVGPAMQAYKSFAPLLG
jgi:hypothetical protein